MQYPRPSHDSSAFARWSRLPLSVALVCLVALTSVACTGTRKVTDPVVNVTTQSGTELGVSTEYGVVFLGRTSERGEVEIESFFGDGPSIERSIIEPIGGGLFTAEMDIDLPFVGIAFDEPRDGELLEILGRNGRRRWSSSARVRTDPRVFGLLLEIPSNFRDDASQVGAGVYRKSSRFERELVGLVAGKVRLERGGQGRDYLAVVGPNVLWRLAAHRRDLLRKKPFVYREDIL